MPRLTAPATGAILLLICVRLVPAHVQLERAYSADDPYGLKIWGMPKANRKYPLADLPVGTEVPSEYTPCGSGVYYMKEKVRGVNVTAVMVHYQAEGDWFLTGDPPDPAKTKWRVGFESYVPPGWVALTFTLHRDALSLQEIRMIRVFSKRPLPQTTPQWRSLRGEGIGIRLDRSWVDKDPYLTWEVLPESQLSHLIFRIRLPKSTKACLESKK